MLLNPANDWNGAKQHNNNSAHGELVEPLELWERTGPRKERSAAVELLELTETVERSVSYCCLLPAAQCLFVAA